MRWTGSPIIIWNGPLWPGGASECEITPVNIYGTFNSILISACSKIDKSTNNLSSVAVKLKKMLFYLTWVAWHHLCWFLLQICLKKPSSHNNFLLNDSSNCFWFKLMSTWHAVTHLFYGVLTWLILTGFQISLAFTQQGSKQEEAKAANSSRERIGGEGQEWRWQKWHLPADEWSFFNGTSVDIKLQLSPYTTKRSACKQRNGSLGGYSLLMLQGILAADDSVWEMDGGEEDAWHCSPFAVKRVCPPMC